MPEKFGKFEATGELNLGELVQLKSDLSESIREMLAGSVEAGKTYKLHYIDVDEEDGIMNAYIGPVDLEFDPAKYGSPESLPAERKLRSVALKHLRRAAN